jgi:hypothetical protein
MASLDTVAHVYYRLTRTRAAATDLVFSSASNPLLRAMYRQVLYERALELQSEHSTLLYGGRIMLEVKSRASWSSTCCSMQAPTWFAKQPTC